jgi:hypothetical protein
MSKNKSLFLRLKAPVVQAIRDKAHLAGLSPNNLVRMWLRSSIIPPAAPAPEEIPEWTIMHLHVPSDVAEHYKGRQPDALEVILAKLGRGE